MITGHVFMAMSLDGFVARKNHGLDWLMKQKTEGEDHGYEAFQARMDGIVMGRGSYQNVLSFGEWPYTKPVIVMSKTLQQNDVPKELADKVRITDQEPQALMDELQGQGWSRAYIDGGKVVQSFVRAGLVEDFVVTMIPVLIGEGIRLFGAIDSDIDLELLGTQAFESGLLQTRYRVVKT
jgi:dihydrofolate reductase